MKNIDPPNFKGGVPICQKTRNPVYESEKEAKAFYDRNCPGFSIKSIKPCAACGGFHVEAIAPEYTSNGIGTRSITKHNETMKVRAHNQEMSDRSEAEFYRLKSEPQKQPMLAKRKTATKVLQSTGGGLI